MNEETMTDARALDFIRVYLAPYAAHGEKDQVVEHIAARLRGDAAQPVAVAGDAMCVRCGDKPEGADSLNLTLSGLVTYGRVAANPAQGASRWHLMDLVRQMVPHLEAALSTQPAPSEQAGGPHFDDAAPAPVAGDAVAKLPAKWRSAKGGPGDYDRGRIAANQHNADELTAALAQDRAAQAGAPVDTSTNEAWIARAESKLATQPPAVGVDVSDEMVEVVKFLLGEGPLRGAWFGEEPPDALGPMPRYWWRKDLSKTFAAALRTGGGA